jgi:hypothetical protein
MIGPAKLANKTCAASVAKMNSAHKRSVGSKQTKPSQTKLFLSERMQGKQVWNCSTIVASEAENFPYIVKISSNENKMKKQCKMFSIDEKMQVIAEVDAHV